MSELESALPIHFYKYRSLGGNFRKWTERIVTCGEIYFANPVDFNDPFDCHPHAYLDVSTNSKKDALFARLRERNPEASLKEIRKRMAELIAGQRDIHQLTRNVLNNRGILSLSATFDHPQMWAHYADSHRGICLRFNADDVWFFRHASPVIYQMERPIIVLPDALEDGDDELINKAMLTKAEYWRYENEWRVIDKSSGVRNFPSALLDGIILGALISGDDSALVRSWANDRVHKPEILLASLDRKEFKLRIEGDENPAGLGSDDPRTL